MNKQKVIGLVVGIVLFIVMIAGITTAYLAWSSQNINNKVSSKCFNVLYDKGTDLSGAIMPSNSYGGGLSTTIKMNLDTNCNVNAKGRLYLDTKEETSSNLFRTGLLNYAVVRNETTIIASGNITESGEIAIDLGKLANTDSAFTRYSVYVWLDYNLIENSDVNSVYYGSIRAEAIQEEGDFSDIPVQSDVTPISDFQYYLGSEYPTVDTAKYYDEFTEEYYDVPIPSISLNENEVLLTRYNGTSKDVRVPDTYVVDGKTYNVVLASYIYFFMNDGDIDDDRGVFNYNDNIESVLLGENIKIISVTFDEVIENDANSLFSYCTNLISVPVMPTTVEMMNNVFLESTNLVDAPEIPSSVTSMISTFFNCTSLVNAPEIPASVTNIESTFVGCTSLTGIVKINYAGFISNSFGDPDTMAYVFSGTEKSITVSVPKGSNTYNTFYNNLNTEQVPSNVTLVTHDVSE